MMKIQHTDSSSVSTDSYYGYHDDKINQSSTADSRDSSASINLMHSVSSGWSRTRKRNSSPSRSNDSSLSHAIKTLLVLQSMGVDVLASMDTNGADVSRMLQDMIMNQKLGKIQEDEEEMHEHSATTDNKYNSFSGDVSSNSDWAVTTHDRSNNKKRGTNDLGVVKKLMKNNKAASKFKNLTELIELKGSYVCKECNEVFNDYRGLGGHMAAHNRKKRAAEEAGGAGGDLSLSITPVTREKSYNCDLCSRSFSTGQALGGHKTSHRTKARLEAQARSALGDASAVQSTAFKLDLNAPPHESLWGV